MQRNWLKFVGGVSLTLFALGGTVAHAGDASMSEWDADGSGDLSYEEWDAGFNDEGLVSDWDANSDNTISEDEYGEGFYNAYDDNSDGILDNEEFEAFQDDAGSNGIWDV